MSRRSIMLSAQEAKALDEKVEQLNRKLAALGVPLLSAADLAHIVFEQGLQAAHVSRHGAILLGPETD